MELGPEPGNGPSDGNVKVMRKVKPADHADDVLAALSG